LLSEFAEYQPRPGVQVGFTSGPEVAHFERAEWLALDPFSASAALHRGEIDWWENAPRDLVDQVSGDPRITVVRISRRRTVLSPSTIAIRRLTTGRYGERCSARSTKRR
jgi:hypothetical protein